uniref:Uncharacterized protein n=1 Tax=Calcidiscus leptoporus TaxID=127549 RepID=A0A6U5JK40_9EUKA|mmetsp:Transcript_41303/g.96556  ORF Transcript_41303/g.96556 Transcript_41303/m.96556 type:complete len:186 (+) Transcript_41303:105-662(+)
MMLPRRHKKSSEKSREIPQWKLDMMAETEPATKRPREDAAEREIGGSATRAKEHVEAAAAEEAASRDFDDDDDSDGVDLSTYDLGGDEPLEEHPVVGIDTTLPELTREELLLKREQEEQPIWGGRLDGGRRKPGRKVFIDETWGSQELSLGGERAKDRKRALELAERFGISAVPSATGGATSSQK